MTYVFLRGWKSRAFDARKRRWSVLAILFPKSRARKASTAQSLFLGAASEVEQTPVDVHQVHNGEIRSTPAQCADYPPDRNHNSRDGPDACGKNAFNGARSGDGRDRKQSVDLGVCCIRAVDSRVPASSWQ